MGTRAERLSAFLEDVWSAGNVDACACYVASAYTIHHDPGDPWEGRTLDLQRFEERVRASRAPFPDQRFLTQGMFAGDDAIAVAWLWEATHRGDLPGFPATGGSLRMSGATVYYFDEADRICGHWQVTDRLGIFQQLQAARA